VIEGSCRVEKKRDGSKRKKGGGVILRFRRGGRRLGNRGAGVLKNMVGPYTNGARST